MKTLIALLTLTSVTAFARPQPVLHCNNEMFNVVVLTENQGASKERITISISDISGHGKDYSVQVARGTSSAALAQGITATSDQDDLGRPTGLTTGRETFKLSGQVADLGEELPAQVQCIDVNAQ